jgi:hypothetical protein
MGEIRGGRNDVKEEEGHAPLPLYQIIFYQNHFNIFTDTSDKIINTVRGDFKLICPGFLATYNG